jgi:hypothetical protein
MSHFKSKSKSKHSLSKSSLHGPKASAASYRGPIDVKDKDEVVDVDIYNGYICATTSSSGSATQNGVFPASTVTTIGDFTEYSGLYQEFRVLGMLVQWAPSLANSTPANAPINFCSPMFLCPSHIDQTPLTGDVLAYAHQGRKMLNYTKPGAVTIRMNGTEEAKWNTTLSGTTSTLCVKTYWHLTTTTATPTFQWGTFYITYNVQFRGRVITDIGLKERKMLPRSSKPATSDSLNSLLLKPQIAAGSTQKEIKIKKDEKNIEILRTVTTEPSTPKLELPVLVSKGIKGLDSPHAEDEPSYFQKIGEAFYPIDTKKSKT